MRLIIIFAISFSLPAFSQNAPLIIGLNADMSAVAAEGGVAISRGAQLAIDNINKTGGLMGRQLMLNVRDHRGNPARGLANIKQFAQQDNVLAVLGGVHTPVGGCWCWGSGAALVTCSPTVRDRPRRRRC